MLVPRRTGEDRARMCRCFITSNLVRVEVEDIDRKEGFSEEIDIFDRGMHVSH